MTPEQDFDDLPYTVNEKNIKLNFWLREGFNGVSALGRLNHLSLNSTFILHLA